MAPGGGGRTGGAAVGTAVHGVLETVDLHEPGLVGPLSTYHAARVGIAERADEVEALARSLLAAPCMDLARRRPFRRELYVAAPVGDCLIEGFVDLCIDGPDGLVIVDYKTDLVASVDDIEAKVHRYAFQGAAYALALRHVTGADPVDCRFLFASEHDVIERSVTDLTSRMERIEDWLRSEVYASVD